MLLNSMRSDQVGRRMILRIFESGALQALDTLDVYDESVLNSIPATILNEFRRYVEDIGFVLNSDKNGIVELKLTQDNRYLLKGWSLRAHISEKELWFSAPRTKSYNSNLMVQTFHTASEFVSNRKLLVFDTFNYEWLDFNSDPMVVRSYDRNAKMYYSNPEEIKNMFNKGKQ